MRRYLRAPWLCQWYPNVTLKVQNKTKILVSKKEKPDPIFYHLNMYNKYDVL